MNFTINALANWRTTFLGIAGIIAIIAKWVQSGSVDMNDAGTIWMLLTSMGLIAAKDATVTGVK